MSSDADLPRPAPLEALASLSLEWPGGPRLELGVSRGSTPVRIEGEFAAGVPEMRMQRISCWKLSESERDCLLARIADKPQEIATRIRIDLPLLVRADRLEFYFRCNDAVLTGSQPGPGNVTTFSGRLRMEHRDRGRERWRMNLDTVPRFTHFDIDIDNGLGEPEGDAELLAWCDTMPLPFNVALRCALIRIADTLKKEMDCDISRIFDVAHLGLDVDYYAKADQNHRGTWLGGWCQPVWGTFVLPSMSAKAGTPKEVEARMSRYASDLATIGTKVREQDEPSDFVDAVTHVLREFAIYARQHAKYMSTLHEEALRDLCLVPIKVVFNGRADGECFQLRGKTDLKVTSPSDSRKYVTGEFKIWRGPSSLQETLEQLTVSHWTGQESMLMAVVISTLKDLDALVRKVSETVEEFGEIDIDFGRRFEANEERFFEGKIRTRRGTQRILVAIIDLHN